MKNKYTDNWNVLIYIRDNEKTPDNIKHHADLLLSAMNTASGIRVKNEVDIFIKENKQYI